MLPSIMPARTRAAQFTARLVRRTAALVAAAVALGGLAASPADAQMYFGQNHVQYDRFKWRVIETEHFLVHYYPSIEDVADDAARMAERSYARLSRLMSHQFAEKKPILLYSSSADFAQSNVFGDLGEGTGGVTDFLRQRMAQFFTGDMASFEHVFQHEMVHVFQYDIFSRGRAGANFGALAQVQPPLWMMEGMAEYFSIGHKHPWTDAWVRDAILNDALPTITQMTERPDLYFPYRYGFSVWQYVGTRWGDDVIAEIMNSIPSIGIERAFRRETGLGLEELSTQWQAAMREKFAPAIAQLDRPRTFAEPLLSQRRSGGIANLFVAPALSPDAKYISFIGYGSLARGEVFPDLFLADAATGKRIARLVKSSTNPDFEQLRFIYSQPSFSQDGKLIAFTGQRGGRDVLYLMDVARRKVIRRIEPPVDAVLNPSFSPDGRQIVFSGLSGGVTDLWTVNVDGSNARALFRDMHGDSHPQWSPDGRTIAFTSDRDTDTDFSVLRFGKMRISLYDVETGAVRVVPGQDGLNINPQWAPDGKSLIFVSDRTGVANLFLYELDTKLHYQLTNVMGAITAVAEYSPAITWARDADVLAFVYYERSDHTIWRLPNPRSLKKAPFQTAPLVAEAPAAAPATPSPAVRLTGAAPLPLGIPSDTVAARRSYYRAPGQGVRLSSDVPAVVLTASGTGPVTVQQMLDSADFALPDTSEFEEYRYKARFSPEYIAQPNIGAQAGGFGQGVFGTTTIILADLMGDHQLAIAGGLNGQLSDAQIYTGYTSLGRRLQYNLFAGQTPIYLNGGGTIEQINETQFLETYNFFRLVNRQVGASALYPLNRFTRFELGASFSNIDYQTFPFFRLVDAFGFATQFERGDSRNLLSVNTISPTAAFVTDNTLMGVVGPLSGRRVRLQVTPQYGTWQWIDYLVDARAYYPIIFNYLTLATRFTSSLTIGRDEAVFPKWVGRPDFVRGFNQSQQGLGCGAIAGGISCTDDETVGSRVAFANVEMRFPVLRRGFAGGYFGLPPIDGLFFYDAGLAWNQGQQVGWNRPAGASADDFRSVLQSYGAGLRVNLFGLMVIRYDYAIPINRPGTRGFGTWWFGANF
jgi:hypothetical protein